MTSAPITAALAALALVPLAPAAAGTECPATLDQVRLTVVYDDHPGSPDMQEETGFACLVEGAERLILFDTGRSPEVLEANLRAVGVEPDRIETVFLSHLHSDHTNGVACLLDTADPPLLYAPAAIADGLRKTVGERGRLAAVAGPMSIMPGVCTLGAMGEEVVEHSMAIHTPKGLVVMTGCAHPGVVEIVERARRLMESDILLVIGGFHLRSGEPDGLSDVARRLAGLGVRHVAPCHCTGARAIATLEAVFGERCHRMGVGGRIEVATLD